MRRTGAGEEDFSRLQSNRREVVADAELLASVEEERRNSERVERLEVPAAAPAFLAD